MAASRCAAISILVLLAAPGILGSGDDVARLLRQSSRPFEGMGRKTKNSNYNPASVDWASVISACRAIGEYEWRLHNFNIRSCFHDGLAVDAKTKKGGMDGSLFSTQERHEKANAGFSIAAYRVVMTVANKYGSSYADTLAVCGAVGVEFLSKGRTKVIGWDNYKNFPVGRLDADTPTPEENAALTHDHGYDSVTRFSEFWIDLGFTVEEGVALIGAHALFDNLACSKSSQPGDDCDPDREFCADKLRMFNWDVHFYHSACSEKIDFISNPPPKKKGERKDLEEQIHFAKCQFSSREYFQDRVDGMVEQFNAGEFMLGGDEIEWNNGECWRQRSIGVNNHCPHRAPFWPFTVNDAHLGRACQGNHPQISALHGKEVQKAMRRFLNVNEWDRVFVPAFVKMVSKYATYVNGQPMYIDGTECPSGWNYNQCSTAWDKNRDHLLAEVEHFVRPADSEQ